MRRRNRNLMAAVIGMSMALLFSLRLGEIQTDAKETDADSSKAWCSTLLGENVLEMNFGEYTCFHFLLPRDEEVKIEIWHSNDVRPLGCLYGISYPMDLSNEGSRGFPIYKQNRTLREEIQTERLETLSTHGTYQKANRIPGMEGENLLIWKGQYVPADEEFPRYVQPGSYEIRITSLDFGCSGEVLVVPIQILGSGEGGRLTKEDIESVMQREETFPMEHMHVLDTLIDPEHCEVSLLSGELLWEEKDFSGEEGKLPFSHYHRAGRYYPDQGLDIAGMGDLWTHSYSYRAEIYRMDIQIYLPRGESISFSREYRKGWQPWGEGELPYRLDETENGFLLYVPTGGSVFFNSEGKATQIVQADGSKIRLMYSGERLYRVTSDTDHLNFQYKNERLVRVTNANGEQVDFTYGEEELASAVLPDGTKLSYTHDEKHQLLQVDRNDELEMAVEYGEYSTMTGRAKVSVLRMPGEGLHRIYSYDEKEKEHMYREKDGGGLSVSYENEYGADYEGCIWTLYDRRGNKIRSSDSSGKTIVYEGYGL